MCLVYIIIMRLYTYPPSGVRWRYILRKMNDPVRDCEHEIIDCGVYQLLNPPYRYTDEFLDMWRGLEPNGWKVVPDFPDIHGEFGGDKVIDNVEESWRLLVELYDPDDESHLPVIQSRYHDIHSHRDYLKRFQREYGDVERVAVGTAPKARYRMFVEKALMEVREAFPDAWVHALGLNGRYLWAAAKYVDSFDTMSWTYPRGRGRGSARSKNERIKFFYEYIDSCACKCEKVGVVWDDGFW